MKNNTLNAIAALATKENAAAYLAETDKFVFAENLATEAGLVEGDENGSLTSKEERIVEDLELALEIVGQVAAR